MLAPPDKKTVTFKSAELPDRELLISHLYASPGALHKDLKLLGPFVSLKNEFLLGASGERRLHIVEVEKKFEERLLYKSFLHLQWAQNNISVWETGSGQDRVDPALMPGIVYVLPEVPSAFIETLGYLNSQIQLHIIQYWYLESQHERGFLFEPFEVRTSSRLRAEKNLTDARIDLLKEQAGLTHKEIMKFLA